MHPLRRNSEVVGGVRIIMIFLNFMGCYNHFIRKNGEKDNKEFVLVSYYFCLRRLTFSATRRPDAYALDGHLS